VVAAVPISLLGFSACRTRELSSTRPVEQVAATGDGPAVAAGAGNCPRRRTGHRTGQGTSNPLAPAVEPGRDRGLADLERRGCFVVGESDEVDRRDSVA